MRSCQGGAGVGGDFRGAHLHGASCTLVLDPALDDLPHLGSFISSSGQA